MGRSRNPRLRCALHRHRALSLLVATAGKYQPFPWPPGREPSTLLQVAFVPNTHYAFTVGKDGAVKYWDADRWELLLTLEGHKAEVWFLFAVPVGSVYPCLPAVRGTCHPVKVQNAVDDLVQAWCLVVSSMGDLVVTSGADRALRVWQRSEEPFFVEEEKEKRLESLFEADLEVSTHPAQRAMP